MNAQELVVVASAGTIAGAVASSKIPFSVIPVVGASQYAPFAVGAAVAVAGWLWKQDGVSDFIEAFGIGMAVSALIG